MSSLPSITNDFGPVNMRVYLDPSCGSAHLYRRFQAEGAGRDSERWPVAQHGGIEVLIQPWSGVVLVSCSDVILVFGTICLDRVRRVPYMPPLGGYVEVVSEQYLLGGEAANTACALEAWGADFRLAGNDLGSGPLADLLGLELAEHGLDPQQGHLIPTSTTPVCDVFVTDAGERTMIGVGFAQTAATVDPARVDYPGGWFTAEPNLGETARHAIRLARDHGMRTYAMDFVGDDDPIFPGSFWQTSTDWAGTRGDLTENLEFVRRWVDSHGCFAILTDGANGLVAGSPESPPRYFPAFPVEQMVDATGSGDVFRAGMLFGLDSGWDVEDCLRFASAAGSLSCQHAGATVQIPTIEEIRRLTSGRS